MIEDRLPKSALWLGLLLVGGLSAWLFGQYQGHVKAQAGLDEVRERAEAHQRRFHAMELSYQSKFEALKLAQEVADSRVAALKQQLEESLEQSHDDAAELALYRRIERGGVQPGLWVDKVSVLAGQPDVLQVTIMQFQGRERAVGEIGLRLSGHRNGQLLHWTVVDADTGELEEASVELLAEADSEESVENHEIVRVGRYDFRFFQTLLVRVKNITTIKPDDVEISIYPDDERLEPSTQQFRWSDIEAL